MTQNKNRNYKMTTALSISALIAAAVALYMLWQFFAAIAVACIAAVVFMPLCDWLHKKTNRKGLAIALTTIFSIFSIVIPLILVLTISVDQIQQMLSDIDSQVV